MVIPEKIGVLINQAAQISKDVLQKNSTPIGLRANSELFQYANWGRDTLFALLGAVEMNDIEMVQLNLNVFRNNQRSDGAIPLRIEERSHTADFINIWPFNRRYAEPKATFKSSQPWADEAVDVTALYIIAAGSYRKSPSGELWWHDNVASVEKAGEWLLNKTSHGLIHEGRVANWADYSLRQGTIGYTNVCTYKAYTELGWEEKAHTVRQAIIDNFWNEDAGYFIDWISPKGKKHQDFCADVNMLAIAFGIADHTQSKKILDFIEKSYGNEIPMGTYFPLHNLHRDLLTKLLFPIYDPETRTVMWWGSWKVINLLKEGHKEKALLALSHIAQIFLNQGTCPEVVLRDGTKSKNTLFHRSQNDMTWTAGLFLLAFNNVMESYDRQPI